MSCQRDKLLNDLLFLFFALFVFGSAFSIALAQVSFGCALILFLALTLIGRRNPLVSSLKWFYLFVGLYIFWMLLSAVVGETPVRSIRILKEEWLFVAAPMGIHLLGNERYRKKIIAAFALGVGVFSLYGVIQHFTGVYWFKKIPPNVAPDFGYIVKGTFSHSLTFGNYYATAAVFLSSYLLAGWSELSRRERLFFGSVSLAAIVATLFSYSRGSIIAMVLGLVVLGFVLCRRKAVYVVGFIAAALLVTVLIFPSHADRIITHTQKKDLDLSNPAGRLFIWCNSLRIVEESPVFGVGQGNFQTAYARYLPEGTPPRSRHVHAHNDLLNVAAIAGLPGMLFFAGMWVAVIGYCWSGWRSANKRVGLRHFFAAALMGSITFFLSSMTEATFADEEVRQMLMFVWSVGLWQLYSTSHQCTDRKTVVRKRRTFPNNLLGFGVM